MYLIFEVDGKMVTLETMKNEVPLNGMAQVIKAFKQHYNMDVKEDAIQWKMTLGKLPDIKTMDTGVLIINKCFL